MLPQFPVGNVPAMPARQAAVTSSGPETAVIGAQMSGKLSDCWTSVKVAKACSGSVSVSRVYTLRPGYSGFVSPSGNPTSKTFRVIDTNP